MSLGQVSLKHASLSPDDVHIEQRAEQGQARSLTTRQNSTQQYVRLCGRMLQNRISEAHMFLNRFEQTCEEQQQQSTNYMIQRVRYLLPHPSILCIYLIHHSVVNCLQRQKTVYLQFRGRLMHLRAITNYAVKTTPGKQTLECTNEFTLQ